MRTMTVTVDSILDTVNKAIALSNEEETGVVKPLTINEIQADFTERGIDSFTFINIVVALENAYDIEFPDDYLIMDELNSVKKIQEVISQLIAN